jgi:hypothetical protein
MYTMHVDVCYQLPKEFNYVKVKVMCYAKDKPCMNTTKRKIQKLKIEI